MIGLLLIFIAVIACSVKEIAKATDAVKKVDSTIFFVWRSVMDTEQTSKFVRELSASIDTANIERQIQSSQRLNFRTSLSLSD